MLSSRSSIDRSLIIISSLAQEYKKLTGWDTSIELYASSWRADSPHIRLWINIPSMTYGQSHYFYCVAELLAHFSRLELLWRKFNSSKN
jgi:hypothetical protein